MSVGGSGLRRYDLAIVGAGVTGANIARRLSAYELDVVLLEREVDVSFGVSKANSGIIHGGFHHDARFLKSRLEIRGAAMFDRLAAELDFPFERCGIVVAAMHDDEMRVIGQLHDRGVANGAIGIELCSRERILELEPKLSQDVVGGLFAPGGGIVEPYRFVFSLVASARKNGVELLTSWNLASARRRDEVWELGAADGRALEASWVVNAAGLGADRVSALLGGEDFAIKGRKGQYYLLDRLTRSRPRRVVFPVPASLSKGMLIVPTVEGTVLIGPTATEVEDREDSSTTAVELETILRSARNLIPSVSEGDVITSFAGVRPVLGEDFMIRISTRAPSLVQVAGIQSPGLTASPAIAEYVKDLLRDAGLRLVEKRGWDPGLDKLPRARDLSPFELDGLVAKDPAWGEVVCRCEGVTEAEIVAAIRAGHRTLDGIKFATRAQMGRCQGGFCTYRILRILLRETGMDLGEITKRGPGTAILAGRL